MNRCRMIGGGGFPSKEDLISDWGGQNLSHVGPILREGIGAWIRVSPLNIRLFAPIHTVHIDKVFGRLVGWGTGKFYERPLDRKGEIVDIRE